MRSFHPRSGPHAIAWRFCKLMRGIGKFVVGGEEIRMV
jgi:hypothetical protein